MIKAAIIVVNADLSDSVKSTIITQLFIDEDMNGEEFDALLEADPTYPSQIHLQQKRILIVRPLTDDFDRSAVDFVLFIKAGLACVEKTKYGPPGVTLQLDRLNINRIFYI